jgi:glycosyltransferase involved in cell wall biosynthesis
MNQPIRVLLNACHTHGGGGLTFLRGVLPELAKDARFDWHLLAAEATLTKLRETGTLPANVTIHTVPPMRFGLSHVWEQVMLPALCRRWGIQHVLSNANYGPLLAPNASVVIHTTPRAAVAWPGLQWKLYWTSLRWLTSLCVWRSPVSFAVAGHVIADYVGPSTARRVRVAHPGMSPWPAGVVAASILDTPKVPNLVLAVGDIYRQKDYPTLLRAMAILRQHLPEVRLVLIGRPAFAEVLAEVQALLKELKLEDTVTLVPGLPHAELLQQMAAASVVLNTSTAECFNLPVLEAMACGTPVVCGDTAFQREVAGEAAVFVPIDKGGDVPAAYAVAAFGVLAHAGIAATLRKAGLARAAQFTYAHTAQVLRDGLADVWAIQAETKKA